MTHPMTTALRTLDPAPAENSSRAQRDISEATLNRIVTGTDHSSPSSGRRHFRPWLIGLPAAAALALTVGLVISALPGASHAPTASYALPAHGSLTSWTAMPQPSPVDAESLAACATAVGVGTSTPLTVLTSERRGDFTSLIVHGGDTDAFCVLADGEVVNWTNRAGLREHPLSDPDEATLSVLQGYEWMITVSGHAGANVTGVKVRNPDSGADVTATIAAGVWSAWWPLPADSRAAPGLFRAYGDEVAITYTTAAGLSHTSSGYEASGDPADPGESLPRKLGSLAGWSADAATVVPSPTEVALCRTSISDGASAGSGEVQLAEKRGDFLTMVLDGDGLRINCSLSDGRVVWSIELGVPTTDAPAAGDAYLTDGNGFDGDVSGTRISGLRGVAGSDVTGVVVHLADSVNVVATVQNSSWLAWWPEDEPAALRSASVAPTPAATEAPAPSALPSITFTTSDGVALDVP